MGFDWFTSVIDFLLCDSGVPDFNLDKHWPLFNDENFKNHYTTLIWVRRLLSRIVVQIERRFPLIALICCR